MRPGSGNPDVLRPWAVPELVRMLRLSALGPRGAEVLETSARSNLLEEVVAALMGGCGAAVALMAVWAPSGGGTCMALQLTLRKLRKR